MNRISDRLCRAALPLALARSCESTIPRSGDAGRRVNCFVTYVNKEDGRPYLLVLGIAGDQLHCLEWDGKKYQTNRQLPLASFEPTDFQITHYYGLSEIHYGGVFSFALAWLTTWPYLKIALTGALTRIDQYLFNKNKLVTKRRIDLLRLLVDRTLRGESDHDPLDLLTELYSLKWVLHPDSEEQRRKLYFYLDSLVHTGEVERTDNGYAVSGLALSAIEAYEEQERRHSENVKMQRGMLWLTLAIVLLTLVQAGLVKLPTLIDLVGQ